MSEWWVVQSEEGQECDELRNTYWAIRLETETRLPSGPQLLVALVIRMASIFHGVDQRVNIEYYKTKLWFWFSLTATQKFKKWLSLAQHESILFSFYICLWRCKSKLSFFFFLFNLAEDSITRANVCFMRLPKGATRPHVIAEGDLNLVARVTGQHLLRIPAKTWLGVSVC